MVTSKYFFRSTFYISNKVLQSIDLTRNLSFLLKVPKSKVPETDKVTSLKKTIGLFVHLSREVIVLLFRSQYFPGRLGKIFIKSIIYKICQRIWVSNTWKFLWIERESFLTSEIPKWTLAVPGWAFDRKVLILCDKPLILFYYLQQLVPP